MDPPRPLWAEGVWTALGPTGPTGRVGAGLTVVHDRLYVSGGVHEAPLGGGNFDGSIAQWRGTRAELDAVARDAGGGGGGGGGGDTRGGASDASAAVGAPRDTGGGSGDGARVRECVRPWVTVEGLQMTTAMHAHAAIAVPWLPPPL